MSVHSTSSPYFKVSSTKTLLTWLSLLGLRMLSKSSPVKKSPQSTEASISCNSITCITYAFYIWFLAWVHNQLKSLMRPCTGSLECIVYLFLCNAVKGFSATYTHSQAMMWDCIAVQHDRAGQIRRACYPFRHIVGRVETKTEFFNKDMLFSTNMASPRTSEFFANHEIFSKDNVNSRLDLMNEEDLISELMVG